MSPLKRHRIFTIIQIGTTEDWPSRLFDFAVLIAILTNLFIAVFETFDASAPFAGVMDALELVTVLFFTVEYALRVMTADYLYPEESPRRAVVHYMTSFPGLIDLLSFLPYYLPVFFPAGVVAFRMFRVVRIFRLFRINAYYDALNVITDVVRSKKDQLLSSVFIILVLMLASSLCMYSLEHEVQPEVFQNAFSGFWWAVSTLLTVGYGDIYPITPAGRLFGIAITFLGVGMVAIPTGILSAGFVEQYTRLKSYGDFSVEADIRFVRLELAGEDHPWLGKTVGELLLPPGLFPAVVQRDGEVLLARPKVRLEKGDRIVLGAEGFPEDRGVTLREMVLRERHPWVGHAVRDLDLSRQTLIALIYRDSDVLVPDGSVVLRPGDKLVLHTRRSIPEALDVVVK
jgi:voltage-gated potassium channel